jgi:ferredoxin
MFGIYYFSGTGNTKAVAELLSQALDANLYNVEKVCRYEDKMIIMHPVYAFGEPQIVLDFAECLPLAHKKVYIIKTAGDNGRINDHASDRLIKILERKGYEVVYDRLIMMGSNYFSAYNEGFVQLLYDIAKKKVDHIAKDIEKGLIRRHESNTLKQRLTHGVHHMENTYGRKQFSKNLRIKDHCITCMKCFNNCPTGNIDSDLEFHDTCIMCMRCIYGCPVDAIYSKYMQFTIVKHGYDLDKILKKPREPFELSGYYKKYKSYINNIEE